MPTKTHRETRATSVEKADANGHAQAVLSFADIIAAPDTRYDIVPTPEWGGATRVASLTGAERQALVTAMRKDAEAMGDEVALLRFAFRVVAASIVDSHGNHVPDQDEAVDQIANKSMEPVQRLFDACRKLSGLGQEEFDQSLEDLKETPSASSITD